MRQLVAGIFGVLCVAIAATSGQVLGSDDPSPGEVEPGDSTPENPFDENACEKSENVPVCTDCTKITVCLNKKALPAKSCPAEAPYCISSLDSGAYCSGQPDPERQQCQDKFQCTSEGYFPDPNDCHYYYLCDSSLKPSKYDCMPGYVFDLKTNGCKRQVFANDCQKLDCSKSNGVWSYYGNTKQYYGYCYQPEEESTATEVVLFKCSDGAEFDGYKCEFKCRQEGKFADSTNRNRYYECFFSGAALKSRVKSCAKGMVFDDRTKFCVTPLALM
ncbi:hypothetical protein quinque_007322 [Culex quinquefasciatus]